MKYKSLIFILLIFSLFVLSGCKLVQEEPTTKIVAIFVDINTFNALSEEINLYKEDVENDLNVNVELIIDNFKNPEDIRKKLVELKKNNLMGSVLIGDIPITIFKFDQEYAIVPSLKQYPSDKYYTDLKEPFDITKDEHKYRLPKELYWTGRINPVGSFDEKVNLLKKYFKRNHDYRTDILKVDKSLLVTSRDIESGPSGDTLEIYERNIKDAFFWSGLYNREQVTLIVNPTKEKFLNELSKPYQTVSVEAHGTWANQEIGDGISLVDIKNIKPKALFYYILTCSAAEITKEDYLASHYLFDGNGLVLLGYTLPALSGADESKLYMEFIAQGDTFGEAFNKVQLRVNQGHAIILGDPTLQIS